MYRHPFWQLGDPSVFATEHTPDPRDVHVSESAFYQICGTGTVGGTLFALILAIVVADHWTFAPHWSQLLLVPAASALMLVGSQVAVKSPSWKVSLAAYAFGILVPAGVLIGALTTHLTSEPTRVLGRLAVASFIGILAAMTTGWLFGHNLQHQRRAGTILLGADAVIVIVLAILLMRTLDHPLSGSVWRTFFVVASILALLHVAHNFSRTLQMPHTADNAVDLAMQNFLEPVNMVLRVPQILVNWFRT